MSESTQRAIAIAGWIVVALALATCSLIAHRSRGRFPSLLDVVRPIVRSTAGRWLFVLVWLWIGVHVFVRHS